ncbi:heavy-metal-associated domain-containing protein [Halorientalis pallida]|uniref:heavy-metal-associated domain-containing protein n=1 Tax=Halorientalis pallida TaxID=2479928 RepID=UPI003C6FE526
MSEYTLTVSGMTCSNCEAIVCDAVADLDGVAWVTADADADTVTVECAPDAESAVRACIDDMGFVIDA